MLHTYIMFCYIFVYNCISIFLLFEFNYRMNNPIIVLKNEHMNSCKTAWIHFSQRTVLYCETNFVTAM